MKDLHTHILPGMDDGAPDVATALQMLRLEAQQGVDTVALTPHFYRDREHVADFLARRAEAVSLLQSALENEPHPRLIVSAEVAYVPGIADWPELEQLCYEGTKTLLVELPMSPWNDELFRRLYSIEGRRGITPMIAHIDRYFGIQSKANIAQLLEMDLPIQISTEALFHLRTRRRAIELLCSRNAALISDCHNTVSRPPDMAAASAVLVKKLGASAARRILDHPTTW